MSRIFYLNFFFLIFFFFFFFLLLPLLYSCFSFFFFSYYLVFVVIVVIPSTVPPNFYLGTHLTTYYWFMGFRLPSFDHFHKYLTSLFVFLNSFPPFKTIFFCPSFNSIYFHFHFSIQLLCLRFTPTPLSSPLTSAFEITYILSLFIVISHPFFSTFILFYFFAISAYVTLLVLPLSPTDFLLFDKRNRQYFVTNVDLYKRRTRTRANVNKRNDKQKKTRAHAHNCADAQK